MTPSVTQRTARTPDSGRRPRCPSARGAARAAAPRRRRSPGVLALALALAGCAATDPSPSPSPSESQSQSQSQPPSPSPSPSPSQPPSQSQSRPPSRPPSQTLAATAPPTAPPAGLQSPQPPLPSFAALEAAGARIGAIRIVTREIFDTDDPKEDKLLFRIANALHVRTRPGVIERALLFRPGDPVSVRVLDETERLLRGTRYLYDVQFRPLAYHDGVVDIEVATRDTWTLDVGVSAGRSGGANTSGVRLKDQNLLGTGVSLAFERNNGIDRSGNEFTFLDERAFGTRATLGYTLARNDDGRRQEASVVRPFYALDARWAAGATASRDDRVDSVYRGGDVVARLRHRQDRAEVFGGWSDGLVDGWVRRWSVGASLLDDAFAPVPGEVAPAGLPPDEKRVAPFVRFELLEDRYETLRNRDLIGQPEYFALGLAAKVQLGWAAAAFGSTRDAWLYTATLSRGGEPSPGATLVGSASLGGEYAGGAARRQRLGAQLRYYRPQRGRWLFYASAAADVQTRPDPTEQLLLGGDNGLRGYPLRYQSGTRRALFTLEERFYTDLYVYRLFRIGGAAFVDAGRAWGGRYVDARDPGWLGDAGIGLRIVSVRSSFDNVLHLDLAFPLAPRGDIRRFQFLVKTKASF